MMMSVLIEAALRSLILGLVVGLGLKLFRVRNAQIEMTAWSVVLAAALAMPLLMQWPILHLTAAPAMLPRVMPALDPSPVTLDLPRVMPPPSGGFRLGAHWLVSVYGAVAIVLLLRLATGLAMTGRVVRRALPIRAGWTTGVDVRVSDVVKSPVAFGRVVLLPAAYATWPLAKRRAVMAHERSHLEHHDFTIQLLSAVHAALFWFSPLAWWLQIRLAFLAERTSDETAIAELGSRIDYAELLLDIAVGARSLPGSIAMARPAMLRQRVESILSRATPAIALTPRRRLLLGLGLLPGVLVIGGTVWRANAADVVLAPSARPAVVQPAADPEAEGVDERSFAIFSDGNTTTSGHDFPWRQIMKARSGAEGDAILFMQKGTLYAVTDPALVAEAAELFRPQQDLGHQQGELGRQQGELGRQQGELGRQQGEIGREMGSLARQQAKEAAKHAVAVAKQARLRADDDDDNSVNGQDFEQSMAQLRQKMETLSDEQKDLGGEQKKLGAQQKALGAEQSRLAHGADAKMQGLIDRALSSGAATPTP
jgi:beta-lactamase regulating signal transducer with metallopeptidase domain